MDDVMDGKSDSEAEMDQVAKVTNFLNAKC